MHPILFTFPDWLPLIGSRSIHIYGLMIALGFLFAMWWIKRESKIVGMDQKRAIDLFFYTMIAGLVGARILFVIHSVDNFWADPLILFRVWEGGLVFQGGIIGAFIVLTWSCWRYKISFLKIADIFSPGLSMGHAIGRIGCFFAGCCYGRQCDPHYIFAVTFPKVAEGIAPAGVPLYPTQLFEAFGEIIIFTLIVTYRKKKPFDGAVFLLYLILYSILRSFLELLRGDIVRGFVVEPYISNAQFISLIMILGALITWGILAKRKKLSKQR